MTANLKSLGEKELCLKKALECQHAAMTSVDAKTRRTYLHLSQLWREVANATHQETAVTNRGFVTNFPGRGKRLTAV
jgi:hypothetical protein